MLSKDSDQPTLGKDEKRTAACLKTSHIIVVLKLCHHAMSHLSILGSSGSLCFKYENVFFNGEQEKESIFSCEHGIEISVPRDLRLSSLGKPCDVKW